MENENLYESQNQVDTFINTSIPKTDEQTRPMTIKEYVVMLLTCLIPVVGIVYPVKWAIGGDTVNLNKRNFWRAYFMLMLIMFGIVWGIILIVAVITGMIGGMAS